MILLGLAGEPVLAMETLTCLNDAVIAQADTPALRERICTVVDGALTRLTDCQLPVPTQTIRISLVECFGSPMEDCLALYHREDARIEVLTPEAMADRIVPGHPFAALPLPVLFDSLLVHELSHALASGAPGLVDGSHAEMEYIAYAMQLAWLPAEARGTVLERVPLTVPATPDRLNDFTALAAPERFAALTWTHFSAPENGCGFVGRLVRGEVSLGRRVE
ncbi:MAG: hypothetical protein HUJ24_05025 [Rhodobacteraceae bacterium]|nr:hypothetical protein [Paracoccaceae bacterium]